MIMEHSVVLGWYAIMLYIKLIMADDPLKLYSSIIHAEVPLLVTPDKQPSSLTGVRTLVVFQI